MKGSNYLILFFLLLLSCTEDKERYEDAVLFDFNDFEYTQALQSSKLEFDSLIMKPTDLVILDSLLITIEVGRDKIFHIYNLNQKKHINQCIGRGQGPEEMLQPEFMNCDEKTIRVIDLATSTVFEYEVSDFIVNSQPMPKIRTKLDRQVFLAAQQIGNRIMGCSYANNERLFVFDLYGKSQNSMIAYPNRSTQLTEIEKTDAYYMKFITNDVDKIALCYYMTDLIEIYDLKGVLEKRLHGPEQFFSHFEEFHDGEFVSSSSVSGLNRDAYMSPRNAGEEFFVLYNGGFIDEPNHSTSCTRLFTFNWDGTPKKIFKLDVPIFSFNVDVKNKRIVGISETPEFHIVQYQYE